MPRGAGVVWALGGLRVRAGCAGERREGERATQTDGQSVSRGGEGDDADADARQGLSTGDAALLSPRATEESITRQPPSHAARSPSLTSLGPSAPD